VGKRDTDRRDRWRIAENELVDLAGSTEIQRSGGINRRPLFIRQTIGFLLLRRPLGFLGTTTPHIPQQRIPRIGMFVPFR